MTLKTMVTKTTTIATKRLKLFPVKGRVSRNYIPHIIIHGLSIDDEKHFHMTFGAYVQVSD